MFTMADDPSLRSCASHLHTQKKEKKRGGERQTDRQTDRWDERKILRMSTLCRNVVRDIRYVDR